MSRNGVTAAAAVIAVFVSNLAVVSARMFRRRRWLSGLTENTENAIINKGLVDEGQMDGMKQSFYGNNEI